MIIVVDCEDEHLNRQRTGMICSLLEFEEFEKTEKYFFALLVDFLTE